MIARNIFAAASVLIATALLAACSVPGPDAPATISPGSAVTRDYTIGPGDQLQVFVWRSPELSTMVRVRPDGRISVPLIDDLAVEGKTPSAVGREIEQKLSEFVKGTVVTVMMTDFVGPLDRQIRVIGEASKPQSISYRNGITVLDVIILSGGLTQYAAGNRASIVRAVDGRRMIYRVRLDDLLNDGDISANVPVAPGDILIIPQSYF
ncbi:XrtA/PEP-CTERM system exopolysaccharide export protein [Magnetospirillum moscoviense]|uniref:Sugar ABC transporter substrate-binding protein n=1 Tax=Magnetospirillum moscoviense TaxID=1437059 RepID=A0A178MTB7_9PROT|nr:XrtA/PEP-CTERM system exopolysaccharide export protein [Magnetospirillum moscoviense]OAN51575.1 sugar ABC transporter substrate-binding protein [Magnetospirillum moscoviense]